MKTARPFYSSFCAGHICEGQIRAGRSCALAYSRGGLLGRGRNIVLAHWCDAALVERYAGALSMRCRADLVMR